MADARQKDGFDIFKLVRASGADNQNDCVVRPVERALAGVRVSDTQANRCETGEAFA